MSASQERWQSLWFRVCGKTIKSPSCRLTIGLNWCSTGRLPRKKSYGPSTTSYYRGSAVRWQQDLWEQSSSLREFHQAIAIWFWSQMELSVAVFSLTLTKVLKL